MGFLFKHFARPRSRFPRPARGREDASRRPAFRLTGEIAFTTPSSAAVDATHREWAKRGLTILQPPIDLDFGRTFLARDPDGNRLRVFAPAGA
ncbi:MAG TPA: VOC family protein [Stellaceae bacterium]|nr:VOC family protein [Stellaceae bacterium]